MRQASAMSRLAAQVGATPFMQVRALVHLDVDGFRKHDLQAFLFGQALPLCVK